MFIMSLIPISMNNFEYIAYTVFTSINLLTNDHVTITYRYYCYIYIYCFVQIIAKFDNQIKFMNL